MIVKKKELQEKVKEVIDRIDDMHITDAAKRCKKKLMREQLVIKLSEFAEELAVRVTRDVDMKFQKRYNIRVVRRPPF